MTHPDARPYVWMLCGTFSFSIMAVLVEALTRAPAPGAPPLCDWQTASVFRAGLVTIFAAVLAKASGVRLVWFRPARLWVRSVAGSCSMVCAFYAFQKLPSSDVVTLSNTFPIWVMLMSWPLYRQYPGTKTFVAILVGVAGMALVEQPHIESGNLGVLAALASAWFSAVAMLGLHRLHDIDPRAVVVHFSAVATVFCVGAFLVTPRSQPLERVLEAGVLLKALGIGVSATIGQVFLTLAFGRGAPAKVSVVGLMQIVFVLAFSVWLFDRGVNEWMLVGTALVIAPTAWVLSRPKATSEVKEREKGGAERDESAQETLREPQPEVKPAPESEPGSFRSPVTTPQLRP
jgi:drug/metabolite transporter (DMT)-like permease